MTFKIILKLSIFCISESKLRYFEHFCLEQIKIFRIQTIKFDTNLFLAYGPAWSPDMYMEEHPYMCSQNRRHRDLYFSVQFGVYETYKPFSA